MSPAPPSPPPALIRGALAAARWRATHLLTGCLLLVLDALTGQFLMLDSLFVVPVSLAAWFCSARMGFILGVILPLGRAVIEASLEKSSPPSFIMANAAIRIVALVLIAYLACTVRQKRELERKIVQLEGILPICCFCKRIRDEDQNWQQLEKYISAHSQANFTHSFCPKCAREHYGDLVGTTPDT